MNALLAIQCELKVPKGNYNNFGKFRYRTCDDIVERVKPILPKYDAQLTLTDELVLIGEWVFLKATATLKVGSETYISCGFAGIDRDKKGMDFAQATGAASSYARKYALCGLFLIDDERDSDAQEPPALPQTQPQTPFQKYFGSATIQIQRPAAPAVMPPPPPPPPQPPR